ncbi:universal stress protein [Leifsonia sp. fls2-241-R2A-40a]|uniref:universal stress protein n=1 Tax=Leifsonia sp. fls2-241-R2A-40a TaxID=3040290 RepID=UPI00254C444C|nr:universal stress protein [Leifsonia sp. fls2-241-R2A-40a]
MGDVHREAQDQGDAAPSMEGAVVVGVHRGQSTTVVAEAARLADELGRPLLCGYVGEDTYLAEWDKPDAVAEESLHPTAVGAGDGEAALALSTAIGEALDEVRDDRPPPSWALRLLAGDPAKALGRLASEVDARLIVVGTRRRGMASALEDRLAGSVAARLAHDQLIPVVVVPVDTKDRGQESLA